MGSRLKDTVPCGGYRTPAPADTQGERLRALRAACRTKQRRNGPDDAFMWTPFGPLKNYVIFQFSIVIIPTGWFLLNFLFFPLTLCFSRALRVRDSVHALKW